MIIERPFTPEIRHKHEIVCFLEKEISEMVKSPWWKKMLSRERDRWESICLVARARVSLFESIEKEYPELAFKPYTTFGAERVIRLEIKDPEEKNGQGTEAEVSEVQ